MIPFDAFTIDETVALGTQTFTRAAILDFARAYDPQPFHVDDAAAAESHFGALCASGWHTASVWMKLMIAWGRRHPAHDPALSWISPGLDDLTWSKPVYVGDEIAYYFRVLQKRPLESRPNLGLIVTRNWAEKADGTEAMAMTGTVFVPL